MRDSGNCNASMSEMSEHDYESFVMSNCDVVTFPLVYWVRCGA